jgi:GTPase
MSGVLQVLRRVTASLLLVDSRAGVTAADIDVAKWLRQHHCHRPILVLATKCDNLADVQLMCNVHDVSGLGLGDAVPYSAESKVGTVELYDALRPLVDTYTGGGSVSEGGAQLQEGTAAVQGRHGSLPAILQPSPFGGWIPPSRAPAVAKAGEHAERGLSRASDVKNDGAESPVATPAAEWGGEAQALAPTAAAAAGVKAMVLGVDTPIKLAIVGLPNVGKSTLLNKVLGYERVVTGPEPGLTRDAVSALFEWETWQFELVDTAGWMKHTTLHRYDNEKGRVAGLTVLQVRIAIVSPLFEGLQ